MSNISDSQQMLDGAAPYILIPVVLVGAIVVIGIVTMLTVPTAAVSATPTALVATGVGITAATALSVWPILSIMVATAFISTALGSIAFATYYAYKSDSLYSTLNELINPKSHFKSGFSIPNLLKATAGILCSPFLLIGSCIGRATKNIAMKFSKVERNSEKEELTVKNVALIEENNPMNSLTNDAIHTPSLWKKNVETNEPPSSSISLQM